MKKFILGFVILLITSNVTGQTVSKLRATDFCYKTKSEYTSVWSEWTSWETVNILIVIDYAKLRISIYSDSPQEYDIVESFDARYDSDGDEIHEFRAIDQDGVYCGIRFMIRNEFDQNQLYIDYSNMKWVYNVYTVD